MNTITSLLIARAILLAAMLEGRMWPFLDRQPVGLHVLVLLIVAYLLIVGGEVRMRRWQRGRA